MSLEILKETAHLRVLRALNREALSGPQRTVVLLAQALTTQAQQAEAVRLDSAQKCLLRILSTSSMLEEGNLRSTAGRMFSALLIH